MELGARGAALTALYFNDLCLKNGGGRHRAASKRERAGAEASGSRRSARKHLGASEEATGARGSGVRVGGPGWDFQL